MPWIIPIVAGVAGSIGGAAIAAHGAGQAASTQANAANYAAQLQKQAADESLAFQKQVFGTQQSELYPWLGIGTGAAVNLANLLGIEPPQGNLYQPNISQGGTVDNMATVTPARNLPAYKRDLLEQNGVDLSTLGDVSSTGAASQMPQVRTEAQPGGTVSLASLINPELGAKGSLLQPFGEKFTAPTDITEQNDPGFKARLALGQQALERSAAARGGVLSGGTLKDLTQFAQDYASNEYGNVYGRAFNEYATRYNQYQQSQADRFNRLASLAGVGQTTAGQLAQIGGNTATNVGNILMGSAGQIGANLQNAAAARGTGYLNSGNIWGNTLSSLPNLLQLLKNRPSSPSSGGLVTNIPQYDPVTGEYTG